MNTTGFDFDAAFRRRGLARHFALRGDAFDNLALHSGLLAQRLDSSLLILDGGQVFVRATARQKTGYTSGTLEIWATNPEELETSRQLLLGLAGDQPVREELFTIDWHFTSPGQGLTSATRPRGLP